MCNKHLFYPTPVSINTIYHSLQRPRNHLSALHLEDQLVSHCMMGWVSSKPINLFSRVVIYLYFLYLVSFLFV